MKRFTEWNKLHVRGMGLPKADCYTQLAKYENTGLTPEEVQELSDKKKNGLLIKLPCKIGTLVASILYNYQTGSYYIGPKFFTYDMIDKFGETVFLTREEAAEALEKIKKQR